MLPFEKVLSFLSGPVSIFYRMMRTVVIATEAAQTTPIMLPLRLFTQSSDDVIHGAYICADATFYAFFTLHMERSVGNEMPYKEAPDGPAEE